LSFIYLDSDQTLCYGQTWQLIDFMSAEGVYAMTKARLKSAVEAVESNCTGPAKS